jgi:Calcineurin-like phosphoesterase
MSQPYSYRNPVLSLWQAAVADVHARRHSVKLRMATVTAQRLETRPLAAADDLMSPVHLIASDFPDQGRERNSHPSEGGGPVSKRSKVESVILDCAKTAAKFLVAEMKGDHEKARLLASELKFSECDVAGWSECVTSYYAFKASGGDRPYRAGRNPVFDLDGKSRIGIIGDWGTGDEVAINLLQQVTSFRPEVLIHLGDVYYAGTQQEQQSNFLDVCRQVLGSDIPLFSLCGNHDMYSGGNGYYWLVDHIGQQASYFLPAERRMAVSCDGHRPQRQRPPDCRDQHDEPDDG